MNDRHRQIQRIFKNPEMIGALLETYFAYRREQQKYFSTYAIHEKFFNNFEAIQKSKKCACYFCGNFFEPSEIVDWTADKTALCPRCSNDTIVQDFDVEITNELLEKLNDEWFGGLRHIAGWNENAPKAHIIDID